MYCQSKEERSHLNTSINYLSNSVYLGRKDSLSTPYISPQLAYYHASGVYATASLSYLARSEKSRLDLFTVGLGFERSFTERITAGAWLEKYFYNVNSTNVQAEMKAMAGIYSEIDIGPVQFEPSFSYSFANKNDWIGGLNVSHTLFSKNKKLEITPRVSFNAATQNFYNSYFQNRRFGMVAKVPKGKKPPPQAIVDLQGAARFKFLEDILSAEIKYTTDRMEIYLLPSYIVPLNPASIKLGNKTIQEKLSNTFTFEMQFAFNF